MNIPKTIHQFWEGDYIPQPYVFFSENLKKLHENWEYTLWNTNSLPSFRLEYIYKYFYDNNYKNKYSVLSDLARYEILSLYGGVYIDSDLYIKKNIEPLLQDKKLVIAKQMKRSHPMSLNSCFFAIDDSSFLHDIIFTAIESRFQEAIEMGGGVTSRDSETVRQKKLWNLCMSCTGPGMITSVIRCCLPKYQAPAINTFHPFGIREVIERQNEPIDSYGIHFFNCANDPRLITIHENT